MLVIKENRIKDLEKFGFYKIESHYGDYYRKDLINEQDTCDARADIGIDRNKAIVLTIDNDNSYQQITTYDSFGDYDKEIDCYDYVMCQCNCDTIFDLIKADMVKKVEISENNGKFYLGDKEIDKCDYISYKMFR